MNGGVVVNKEVFIKRIGEVVGQHRERAINIFEQYGPQMSIDVTNVLFHAADRKRVSEVLGILEDHHEHHLQYQHPDARGQIAKHGVNPTEQMFIRICTKVLNLTLSPEPQE